jgi:aspartate aminotransferase-like enzyme
VKKVTLMVPGPVDVSEGVLAAMGMPQIPHYDDEAIAVYNECVAVLKSIFGAGEKGNVFILPGSGSVALDLMVCSLVAQNDKVLACVNGTFSQRVQQMANAYGADVVAIQVPYGAAVKPEMVEDSLKKHPDTRAVFVAHLETSTGVLNPVREIGEVVHSHGIPLAVDAVSSLGVEEVCVDKWKVSVCASASQKGLESPPGLGIVCVSERAWPLIRGNEIRRNGWFSDLLRWKQVSEGNEIRKGVFYPLPVTMPVNNVFALRESLRIVEAEGLDRRIERHAKIGAAVRRGLLALGFESFPEEGAYSAVETVIANNLGIDVAEMIHYIERNYHTRIGNGLFDLYNRIVRIGHIGQTAYPDAVVPVLLGIEQFLRKEGLSVPSGAALSGMEDLTA